MEQHYNDSVLVKVALASIRRRYPALLVFALSLLCVCLLTVLIPNRYTSHLKLLVKNERANSLISVGGQTQGVFYLNEVSEARINTEIELLTSSDLLRKVVDRCGLAQLVRNRTLNLADRNEAAVHDLKKAMKVVSLHRSDVIEVTYESSRPKLSAEVLRSVSEIYLASHLELHGAPGSYAFFEALWNSTTDELNLADSQLNDFRNAAHITGQPQEKTILLQQVSDLQSQAAGFSASAKKSEQEANAYSELMHHMAPSIEKERRSVPNQEASQQLGTLLVTLRNKHAEVVTRYLPGDRIVSELDAQIRLTQDAIDKIQNSPAQEVASGFNPTYQNAEMEFIRARAGLVGNAAQARSLQQEIESDQHHLVELAAATVTYDKLSRRSSELASLRETYRKGRDEAKMSELLDQQKLSNVAVLEEPIAESIASSPRRGVILGVGFVFSIVLAAITAFLLEVANPRIASVFELEEVLTVPLLAAVLPNASVPFLDGDFPQLYLAMQRTRAFPDMGV